MYLLRDFGNMLLDRARVGAYVDALTRTVKPGDVVVDIGAGTGIFALVAARLGAKKVYALEPNPVAEVARAIVRRNGYAGVVEVSRKLSTELVLAERADVVVADLRGMLPLFGQNLVALKDARERLLKPGGALLPKRDVLKVAVVEHPAYFAALEAPWETSRFGFDMSDAFEAVTSDWYSDQSHAIEPRHVITDTAPWASIEYATFTSYDLEGSVRLTATRAGVAHGLALSFDATIADGAGYATGPGEPGAAESVYRRAFFPWPRPVALSAGDVVEVRLRAVHGPSEYTWSWASTIRPASRPDGATVAFRQTNFFVGAESPARLLAEAPDRVVGPPSPKARAMARTLELLPTASLGAVARTLRAEHPETFATELVALEFVRSIARKVAAG